MILRCQLKFPSILISLLEIELSDRPPESLSVNNFTIYNFTIYNFTIFITILQFFISAK